jgi:hypothetical protein
MGNVSLSSDDLDKFLALHAPHLLAPPGGPTGPTPSSPPAMGGAAAPDTLPVGMSPAQIAKPTREESQAAGKVEFQAGKPTVTEAPNSPGYFRQQAEQQDYEKAHPWGSPVSEHPGFLGKVAHGFAKAGNIAGDIVAPGIMQNIPGTDLNKQAVHAGTLSRQSEAEKQETQQQKADTEQEGVEQRPEIAEATGELKGRLETQKEGAQADRQAKSEADRDKRSEAALNSVEDRAEKGRQATEAGRKEHDTLERDLTGQREAGENKRLSIREAGENARSAEKGKKPTADEQRRADLAENLNENLNTLEDVAKRRPDLFGPMAGRITQMRGAIGTGDKDIATLETIKHQIGMAQISAHGMRSAHGIEAAADSILNNLHNQPEAVMSNIQAVRNSIKTFQDDVDKAKGGTGNQPQSQGSGGGGAKVIKYDAQGNRVP